MHKPENFTTNKKRILHIMYTFSNKKGYLSIYWTVFKRSFLYVCLIYYLILFNKWHLDKQFEWHHN